MKKNNLHRCLRITGIIFVILFAVFFVLKTSGHVFAQDLSTGGSGLTIDQSDVKISDSISKATLGATVLAIVNYFLGFLGLLATLAFIYAGVLWVASGGAEEPITKAKKIMTYASLGIVVVLLSYSAVSFITKSAGGVTPSDDSGGGLTGPYPEDGSACHITKNVIICGGTSFTIPVGGEIPKDGTSCIVDKTMVICGGGTSFTIPTSGATGPAGATGPGGATGPAGARGDNGKQGEPGRPATDGNIDKIDGLIDGLGDDLDTSGLSTDTKPKVDNVLKKGGTGGTGVVGLDNKIGSLKTLLNDPDLTESDRQIIETIIGALGRLKMLRAELDDLRKNMPESKETIAAYDETSNTLDELINDPSSQVLFSRFDAKYKNLKDLINKFPFVKAAIYATPGFGSVPFTVQLDGLNSVDPTGGTISDYKWSYLDNSGNEVSLGSDPVVLHDFTEVNTYVVQLRAGTSSKKDSDGYKLAADGISTIRITANPPTSQVRFRVNGIETYDILNMTLKEAQAGLSFDPSTTTAALGRKIVQYKWSFGDSSSETRNVPTTVVHTYDKTGEYIVKLEVTDSIGIKDSGIVRLFVKSVAADILVTPPTGDVNNTFTFVGVGSRSDDGIIRSYEWELDDDAGKFLVKNEQKSFSYKFGKPGVYYAVLTVTDIGGTKDRFNKTIVVGSRTPVASFTTSIPKINHPNRVEFNAIDSYDPDEGDSITYSWDFDGDGNFDVTKSKDAIVTYDYVSVGEYRAKLQVQDGFGKYSQIEKRVSIDSVLSADIAPGKLVGRVGEPMDFQSQSNNAVAYLWEFGDGETQSTEETKVSHTYSKVGKFTVKLNFFDKDDNSNTDTQNILVGAGDQPVAFVDYTIDGRAPKLIEDLCGDSKSGAVVNRAEKISFDAKNSINIDGSSRLLSYDWQLPSGEKDSNKQTLFKFDEINREGECFNASLVVRDQTSGKISDQDIIYFKVINELPTITDFVIIPPAVPSTGELITPIKIKLKIINPKDSDGTIKKYRWWYYRDGFEQDKMGVHSTSAPETDMTITSFGEPDTVNRYYFVAEVSDNDNGLLTTKERFGETSYLDVKNGPNLSPVADFNVDKTTISVGDSITFNSKSYDPQGDVLPKEAFLWDFDGDGEFDDTSSGPQINRQYNTPGEYNVRLKVVYRGLSSSVTKTIFVEATQTLPQAAFTYTTDITEGTKVTFDASSSRFDPSLTDTTLRYEWDFDVAIDANGNGIKDDDVESTEVKPTHTYPVKGVYKVKLKVKDMLGMEGIVVRDINLNLTEAERLKNSFYSIKVNAPRQALTTLDISVTPATLAAGDSADINARVLNADGSPYNGKVFFEISEGSGEITPNPVTASDSKASAIFSATEKGKTHIKVRATDTMYGELIEDAVITIK